MSLAAGTMFIGLAEILVSSLDMALTHILEKNTKYGYGGKPDPFYHVKPPYHTNPAVTTMERYGCSCLSICMGFLLILIVKWASYVVTIVFCVCWLFTQGISSLLKLLLAGELMATSEDYLKTRGYEVLTAEIFRVYFFVTVFFYVLSTYEDIKDIQAVAPYRGNIDLEDDESHIQEISKMRTQENDMDENFSRRDHYVHMDISEFRMQVAESRSSRMIQNNDLQQPKKNSYNDEEYEAYLGPNKLKDHKPDII